jgi:hypothetical protein
MRCSASTRTRTARRANLAQIRLIGADIILSHGSDGEFGHPGARAVHRAARRAVEQHAPDAIFYGVSAWVPAIDDRLWNAAIPHIWRLDITPWIERKHAAMLCHRTQHALFVRRRALETVQQPRDRRAFHRFWPPVPDGEAPDEAFARLLLDAGARRGADWDNAIRSRSQAPDRPDTRRQNPADHQQSGAGWRQAWAGYDGGPYSHLLDLSKLGAS